MAVLLYLFLICHQSLVFFYIYVLLLLLSFFWDFFPNQLYFLLQLVFCICNFSKSFSRRLLINVSICHILFDNVFDLSSKDVSIKFKNNCLCYEHLFSSKKLVSNIKNIKVYKFALILPLTA